MSNPSSNLETTGPRLPLVAGVGLFVGVTMLALSATGILWRIDALSVGLSILGALVLSPLLARRFEWHSNLPDPAPARRRWTPGMAVVGVAMRGWRATGGSGYDGECVFPGSSSSPSRSS